MKKLVLFPVIIGSMLLMALVCSAAVGSLSSMANSTEGNQISSPEILILRGETMVDSPVFASLQFQGGTSRYTVVDTVESFNSSLQTGSFSRILIMDYPLNTSHSQMILDFIDGTSVSKRGISIFLGSAMTNSSVGFLSDLGMVPAGETIDTGSELAIAVTAAWNDSLTLNIPWNSVPELLDYTILPENSPGPLLITESNNNPLLTIQDYQAGNIIIWTGWITAETNEEFTLWPYFHYFLYVLIEHSANAPIVAYPDWPYSPVPHVTEQILIGLAVVVVGIISISAFFFAYRKSRSGLSEVELERISQKEETDELKGEGGKDWVEIGPHRQIGGFMIQLFIGMLIIIPNAVFSSLIIPLLILPSPQGLGFYDFTIHFFEALWLVFDVGTSIALVTYFAKHRVKEPEIAVRYIQIFVWWQILTGVIQLGLISFGGAMFFPRTYLAHLTWVFVVHSWVQYPSIFLVFIQVFRAMQRIDLQQIGYILYYAILNLVGQAIFILVFRFTLGQNPIFGEALAGGMGYAFGMIMAGWMTFGITLIMFKRLGFSVKHIFRVDFTRKELKTALGYGSKLTIGQVWVPLVWLLQVFLLSIWLPSYASRAGYFALTWNLILIVSLVALLMESLLGGISESHSHDKKVLTQLYTAEGLKYGALFTFFLVTLLWATGARFIIGGAGLEWAPAVELLFPLLIFQLLGFFSWLGDWQLAGSGRPGWAAAVWILEQLLRATGLIVFIPVFQFLSTSGLSIVTGGLVGVVFAYIPALAVKNVVMWYIIRRDEAMRPKFYVWQTYIGPGLAAIVTFVIIETISFILWRGADIVILDIGGVVISLLTIMSLVIFFIGTLPALYLYSFFTGLTGSWDKNTLAEFDRATNMTGVLRFLSRPLFHAIRLGAKISPLHDKYPIDIWEAAFEEAQALTEEKKTLVI